MKNTCTDEKTANMLDADDKKKIMDACEEAINKDEYDGRQKELESICTPIITKMSKRSTELRSPLPVVGPGNVCFDIF
eukprot:gene3619-10262_t